MEIDFSKLQNPIAGEALNIADTGDMVSVRTKQGIIRCEALTEISSTDVIVFKNQNGVNYALSQQRQTTSEEITQSFKSRIQPVKQKGVLEAAVIFAETIEGVTDFVNPSISNLSYRSIDTRNLSYNNAVFCRQSDLGIPQFGSLSQCISETETQAVGDASAPETPEEYPPSLTIKFWLKINSIPKPIELISFNESQSIGFLWNIDESNVYVTFKVGNLDPDISIPDNSSLSNFPFSQITDFSNYISSRFERRSVVLVATQVVIFVISLKGVILEKQVFNYPEEITYRNPRYYAEKYAYNYISTTRIRTTLGTYRAPGASFTTTVNQTLDYFNEPSVCDRTIVKTRSHNFISETGGAIVPTYELFLSTVSAYMLNRKAAPGFNDYVNKYKNTIYTANMVLTVEQSNRALDFAKPFPVENGVILEDEVFEENIIKFTDSVFKSFLTEPTGLLIYEETAKDGLLVNSTTGDLVGDNSQEGLFEFNGDIFLDPIYALEDPNNPNNQSCVRNRKENSPYYLQLNRLVPEDFSEIDINKVHFIYGCSFVNTLSLSESKRVTSVTGDNYVINFVPFNGFLNPSDLSKSFFDFG